MTVPVPGGGGCALNNQTLVILLKESRADPGIKLVLTSFPLQCFFFLMIRSTRK